MNANTQDFAISSDNPKSAASSVVDFWYGFRTHFDHSYIFFDMPPSILRNKKIAQIQI